MPKTYQNYIFDVDGTIADTAPAILKTIRKALTFTDTQIDEKRLTYELIGPPLPQMIAILAPGAEAEKIETVVSAFRSLDDELSEGAPLYAGIKPLLEKLKKEGKRCFIATNKPQSPTFKLLNALDIAAYFEAVYGPDIDKSRKMSKTEMIKEIIGRFNLDAERTIMIGDTLGDINAAHEAGCRSLAALWGYGKDKEELKKAAAHSAICADEIE